MKSCSKIQMLGVLVLLGLLGSFSGVKPFTPEPLRAGQGTIHNDRLIFSPTLYGYNTQDFLETKPGILKDYRFIYHGEETSAAEVIEFYAYYYSINPQVFLTLLELQSRLLTKPNPPEVDLTYAMGYRDSRFSGFGEQVEWAARMLYQKYYEQLDLAASEQLQVSGQDEAGTVALLNLMETANNGQLNANSTSDQFQDTYRTLFGDSASAPINDGLQTMAEPAWKFPFKYGETWYYTGGPHYGGFGSGPWGGVR